MPLTTLVLPAPTPSPTSPPPIYTLILSSPPDHRLTPELIASFLGHLDDIERDWRERRAIAKERAKKEGVKGYLGLGGSVVIRGEGEKFFSNGLDFQNSIKDPNFHHDIFSPFITRLLLFPLITICAINGHAFAGGFLLSLACDFRVMRAEATSKEDKRRAWCCMNEIDFGAPFPPLFASLLRSRIPPPLLRSCLLGVRFTPTVLSQHGLVESPLASSDADLMAQAEGLAKQWGGKPAGGVWGEIKRGVWVDVVESGKQQNGMMPDELEREARGRLGLGGKERAKL